MNAEEARKLSSTSVKGPVIQPYLVSIYGRIEHAAAKGERSIRLNPEFSLDVTYQYIGELKPSTEW